MIKKSLKGMVLVLAFSAFNLVAQQTALTENDVIKNADALFTKKDYQAALPLYAQLVSLHSDDPQFNYRFGVCTLFGDRKDKKKPIKYLNTAFQTMKDDKEILYFLGLAYHQNQEWSNALKFYNLYLAKLTPNATDRAIVLEKVNSCLNGLTLADKNLVSEIVSTSKFQYNNFHRAYAAQDFIGSLMLKPDIFISESERKMGSNSFVYLVHPSSILYFSGYTDSDNTNRDIYISELDDNGDWGKPVNLSGSINTSFDEDYPVVVDNGNTLYFCSKGHNSLGGYDIFRSTLDPMTNTFTEPENLGPGINSPFDDILFIPTKEKPYAYFASDRDNLNGAITVYKVKLSDNNPNDAVLAKTDDSGKSDFPKVSSQQTDIQRNNITSDQNILAKQELGEPGSISDASKKASTLINDKSKSNALADSAFTMIADLKNLLRDLTNKRDRANAIAQRKSDEAKTVEARLKESIDLLASQTSEAAFLAELEKSVKIKEELYQLQQRSAQANKIAWNLGNQIKIKNQELNDLKTLAGKIQSVSISGTYEETLFLYSGYKKHVIASDTIVDYTKPLMAITNDENSWKLPETELLFAENIKKAYYNNTLLAEVSNKKPVIDNNIPNVVVDKKASNQENKQVEIVKNNTVVALAQVEQIQLPKVLTNNTITDEILEINLAIDNRMEPVKIVQQIFPVYKEALAKSEIEENLEINLNMDNQTEALALVQQVNPDQEFAKFIAMDESLEINLAMDKSIKTLDMIQQVIPVQSASENLAVNEILEIDMELDNQIEALPVVQPVLASNTMNAFEVSENILEINFKADEALALQIIEPVKATKFDNKEISVDQEIEITDDPVDQPEVIALNVIEPIIFNFKSSAVIYPEELGVDISMDQVMPIEVIEPVLASYKPTEIFTPEIELDYKVDQLLASKLILPVEIQNSSVSEITNIEEELEIANDSESWVLVSYNVVEAVRPSWNFNTTVEVDPDLEINFSVDQSVSEIPMIANEIRSGNIEVGIAAQTDLSSSTSAKESIAPIISMSAKGIDNSFIANNLSENTIDLRNKEVASAKTNIFFREAVIQSNGIDSYSSDMEILKRALTNPDELSYEELLYAASLTDVQEEKLAIYNIAFVHVDRDWRAFNNAAVSAIHISDLSSADCYLIQASMLSENNGQIENNRGILAYQKNNLKEASACFASANKLGYDAQYNLQLVSALAEKTGSANGGFQNDQEYNNLKDAVVDLFESEKSGK